MQCRDARLLVSEYLDGDLDPETAAQLEEHLTTCPSCPPLAAALAAIVAQLRSLPEVSTASVGRVLARLSTPGHADGPVPADRADPASPTSDHNGGTR
jgi:anti-sigma factor RsiW